MIENILDKLKKRAEEIAIDGQETVQEVYDSDDDLYKRAFWSFKKWLEWKFQEIISKHSYEMDAKNR